MTTAEQKEEIKANRDKILESLRQHEVVPLAEWTEARLALMEEEKRLMKLHDELGAKKRALPWVKVRKSMYHARGQAEPCRTVWFTQPAVYQTFHDRPRPGLAMPRLFA